MKYFYRVCNSETEQGLWYNFQGIFTGLIHNEFKFCLNSELMMPFDNELTRYLSATDSLESLFKWFTIEDIIKLQNHGWYIHIYETNDYKFYDKFKHQVISQDNSRIIGKIIL